MSKARIIADYAGTGATSDLATQAELDAAETAIETVMGFQSVPHIIPDTLYPAVAGKLLDGSTSHSGAYGTAQSDGRMYYYTDIKGSKPIKDPRIGGHFGSQRHKFKSAQLLEQETATDGNYVYSIDGREWIRWKGASEIETKNTNDDSGCIRFRNLTSESLEITGYFSGINVMTYTATNYGYIGIKLNGVTKTTHNGSGVETPLKDRYVDSGALHNVDVSGLTLGINTVTLIGQTNDYNDLYGIELIAQDTTDTASKSKIQIPAQNVVSYGKKFAIPATAHHYNPFATKGDDSASTIPNNTTGDSVATGWTGSTSAYWESTLDTATSLGLGAWESGGNYYRPVNGGRVVKWVDSSGNIKTSVNMMPPEAHSIKDSSTGTCDATGTHNWSTQYLPQFGNKTVGSDLATNGSFASASNWTFSVASGTWSITSGVARASSAATAAQCYQAFTFTKDKYYKITWTVSGYSAGAVYVQASASTSAQYTANGTYSHTFRAGNTSDYINFRTAGTSTFDIDNVTMFELEEPSLLSEVAKTFHLREFGNGNANGGTTGTYKDASMLTTTSSDIAYVMDDGLTSLSGDNVYIGSGQFIPYNPNDHWYMTFIGTGITITTKQHGAGTYNIAQNLPYGTHILKGLRDADGTPDYTIDGVAINDTTGATYAEIVEATFHQPKMPPIPEDAVVISDYMLMADFVPQTSAGMEKISKGIRKVQASRDVFYDETDGDSFTLQHSTVAEGFELYLSGNADSDTSMTMRIPAFGTNYVHRGYQSDTRVKLYIDTTDKDSSATKDNTASYGSYAHLTSDLALGVYKFGANGVSGTNGHTTSFDIASPIHTSHHYQSFETPFLHELVGGDRNMEQNNLIVTPDGKTWDEVTRDTSYISDITKVVTVTDTASTWENAVVFDEWRGSSLTRDFYNKDFAIAYDRLICLVDGTYHINGNGYTSGDGTQGIKKNGTTTRYSYTPTGSSMLMIEVTLSLKRGENIQLFGEFGNTNIGYNSFSIRRV